MVFSCRQLLFFEVVLLPAVLPAAAGNRISTACRQLLFFRSCSTASSLEKGCFSRISDDTLGSFFTWFWHSLVLQSHGVFLPAAAFFRSCSTVSSTASSCRQQNLAKKVSFLRFQRVQCRSFLALHISHFFSCWLAPRVTSGVGGRGGSP